MGEEEDFGEGLEPKEASEVVAFILALPVVEGEDLAERTCSETVVLMRVG